MRLRPPLGRVGAGALIVVATLAVVGAVKSGSSAPVLAREAATLAGVSEVPVAAHRNQLSLAAATQLQYNLSGPPTAVAQVPAGRADLRVPILMYHYIRNNPDPRDSMGFNLSVTPADFSAQMDWLAAGGYHPIDFNDLRAYWQAGQPLPSKPLIITLDDGYADLYTNAYPILRAHDFKAVAYVVSGFLGSRQNVSAAQIQELDRNGVEIGAHTFSHADLTKVSPAELQRQLVDSKVSLEQILGRPVLDFCYPAGQFNPRVVAAVQAAGYDTATTTQTGVLHGQADRLTWSRVRVSGGESIERLAADLGAPEPSVQVMVPSAPRRVTYSALPRLPLIAGRSVIRALLPASSSVLRPPSGH